MIDFVVKTYNPYKVKKNSNIIVKLSFKKS